MIVEMDHKADLSTLTGSVVGKCHRVYVRDRELQVKEGQDGC